ncbi:MAG TPA: thiamine phosphate synthase [Candidatus Binatia bacterium]|nr:thiamine phosphate synthase [Candidatus Binatia bacterium]
MASRMSLRLPPLYAILDPDQIKTGAIEEVLSELLRAGVKMLQLRAKSLAAKDFLALAKLVRRESQAYNCRFIVNDRADIAMVCNADGVHLGQDDLPLQVGRRLLGNKIIGISTHDLEQARQAQSGGADYIGFGPMFGTQTKDTGYGARGIDMLMEVRAAVTIPIVGIGGINEQNVSKIWQAGADSAAIISDILGSKHIAAKIERILSQSSRQAIIELGQNSEDA